MGGWCRFSRIRGSEGSLGSYSTRVNALDKLLETKEIHRLGGESCLECTIGFLLFGLSQAGGRIERKIGMGDDIKEDLST